MFTSISSLKNSLIFTKCKLVEKSNFVALLIKRTHFESNFSSFYTTNFATTQLLISVQIDCKFLSSLPFAVVSLNTPAFYLISVF